MSPHDPALKGCRMMFLRGMTVQAHIGIHDFELQAPQRLIIDIDVYVDLEQHSPQADQIQEVVDYDFLRAVVHRRISRGHIHLQETLCDDVAKIMLTHPLVMAVRVATAKPDVYPDCDSVGVEVFLIKE